MSTDLMIGIAGLVLSIVGIPLSIFLSRRGRDRPNLRYLTDFDVVISPEDALLNRGLSMRFNQHPITTVSRTIFAVWNHHGSTVLGTDVVPEDRLRLQLSENDSVLRARLIAFSRPQNKAALITGAKKERNRVTLDFDFLDPGDGVIVEVIHEGPQSPSIEGTVRGARLTSSGHGNLTTSKLDIISEKSPTVRVKNWISLQGPTTLVLAMIQICFSLFYVYYFISEIAQYSTEVLPIITYDLNTADGQREFADVARKHYGSTTLGGGAGLLGKTGIISLLLIPVALLVILLGARIRRRSRNVVPKSLLNNRPTEEPEVELPREDPKETSEPSAVEISNKVTQKPQKIPPRNWDKYRPLEVVVGDRVKHDKYGFGVVRGVDGQGPRATATVDFGEAGQVRLMLIGSVPMRKLNV